MSRDMGYSLSLSFLQYGVLAYIMVILIEKEVENMLQADFFLNQYGIQLDAEDTTPEKLKYLNDAFGMHESYEGNLPYIFVSYAHKDAPLVFPAIRGMQEKGYPVWYDAGIRPGAEWAADIAQHLKNASLVLAFVSKNAFDSNNCRAEIVYAFGNRKPMLTVRLDNEPLPDGLDMQLSLSQMFDAYVYSDGNVYVEKLVRASLITKLIQPVSYAPAETAAEAQSVRYVQRQYDRYVLQDYENGKAHAQKGEYEAALECFRKAAIEQHVQAQFEVGYAYSLGRGTKQNDEEAMIWLEMAAAQGHAEAQYLLGCLLLVCERNDEAVRWLRKASEAGHTEATLQLANCYECGAGVPQDLEKAAQLVCRCVEQGVPRAYSWLARLYLNGIGVEKDEKQAVALLQKGASMAVREAQCMLGECLEQGVGIEKDPQFAVNWYRKAAAQESANACYRLGRCYEFGIGVAENLEEAGKWFRKAQQFELYDHKMTWDEYDLASTENAQFHYEIAMLDAPKKDEDITADYLDEYQSYSRDLYIAAKRGHIKAQIALGERYFRYYRKLSWDFWDIEFEDEAKEDAYFEACLAGMRKGLAWVTKAAEKGNAEAQRTLGGLYFGMSYVFEEVAVEPGDEYEKQWEECCLQSHEWTKKAAMQGDPEAQYELACSYNGLCGIPKDEKMEVKWLMIAADNGHAKACEELAYRYREGDGVKKSRMLANMYARKAEKCK